MGPFLTHIEMTTYNFDPGQILSLFLPKEIKVKEIQIKKILNVTLHDKEENKNTWVLTTELLTNKTLYIFFFTFVPSEYRLETIYLRNHSNQMNPKF